MKHCWLLSTMAHQMLAFILDKTWHHWVWVTWLAICMSAWTFNLWIMLYNDVAFTLFSSKADHTLGFSDDLSFIDRLWRLFLGDNAIHWNNKQMIAPCRDLWPGLPLMDTDLNSFSKTAPYNNRKKSHTRDQLFFTDLCHQLASVMP